MSADLLEWRVLRREAIPGVLLGVEAAVGSIEHGRVPSPFQNGDLAIGFDPKFSLGVAAVPCVALVGDSKVGELFAWLHTYSNETFPISQSCRVETRGRWASLKSSVEATADSKASVWASIVVGEMLANAEQRPELNSVPLSWASGCLSYAMARVFRFAGAGGEEPRDAASRLRILESDPRLAPRRVSVDSLSVLWAIATSGERFGNQDVRDVVATVVSALSPEGAALLRNEKLVSSSAEQRIHGYDEFVDNVLALRRRQSGAADDRVGALLAGAALLAGTGTSHVELLKPYADEFPDALPWFGLLAGLIGPKAWDPDWLRLVKGVERQIRAGFQLTDPVQCDLCWIEFDWLRQLSKSVSVFVDLPKLHNRQLTVEVFPGATYQSRLVAPVADIVSPAKTEPRNESLPRQQVRTKPGPPPVDDDDVLAQLTRVSVDLQEMIGRLARERTTKSIEAQGALFERESTAKPVKRSGNRPRKVAAKSR